MVEGAGYLSAREAVVIVCRVAAGHGVRQSEEEMALGSRARTCQGGKRLASAATRRPPIGLAPQR
jgi:hypothetical protein